MENIRELAVATLVSVGNAIQRTNVFTSDVISKLIDNQSDDKLRYGVIVGNAADFFSEVVVGEEIYQRACGYIGHADEFDYGEFCELVHSSKFAELYSQFGYKDWITSMVGLATYTSPRLRDAVRYCLVHKTSTDLTEEQVHRCNRVMQNAIEISAQYYDKLQKQVGATDMVAQIIQKWSWEAENVWENPNCEERVNNEYIDFIDKFAETKYHRWMNENGYIDEEDAKDEQEKGIPDEPIDCTRKVNKKAKLVTFEVCARVVVPDDDDNTAMEQAIEDIRFEPNEYINTDNIVNVEDDNSCPVNMVQEYIIIQKGDNDASYCSKAASFISNPYDIIVYGNYEEAKFDYNPEYDLTIATLVSDNEECHIFVNGDEVGHFAYNEYTQNKVNGVVKSNFQYNLQKFVEKHDFSKYLS